jgi:DNA polymerase-3 subunit alpha
MGFITLDDRSGRIEASLFADAFHSAQSLLQTDAMVVVEGEVSNDDFSGGLRLRVKRVMSMEDARTNLAESLRLKLQTQDLKGDQLRWLGELFKRHRGACPITMEYVRPVRQRQRLPPIPLTARGHFRIRSAPDLDSNF